MKRAFAAAAFAAVSAVCASVSAQTVPPTAEFKCPAVGTVFTVRGFEGESQMAATGQDGTVCLFKSTKAGQTKDLRVHYGLIGSVDAAGESFTKGLDLKGLWPLKVGNKTVSTVNGVGYDGKPYTATVTVTVAAYEKVTVPAGTFDAFRVEEMKAGDAGPRIRWWAPALAASVKESFPDWRDRGKTMVFELVAVTK